MHEGHMHPKIVYTFLEKIPKTGYFYRKCKADLKVAHNFEGILHLCFNTCRSHSMVRREFSQYEV